MQPRLPSLLSPPIVFGHRGARAHAPENTLEAFTLALRLGATGLESDVWLTADGVPVLDHDGVVRVGRRKRAIGQVGRADLPPHIPSLADLIDRCGTTPHLSLDLKDPAAGPAVLAVVDERAPALAERLWLCHPDLAVLEPLRAHPKVRLVASVRLARRREGPERLAASLAAAGIDAVNLHHTEWTGGLVALFHRFERYTLAWDVQFEHHARALLRMGIDAVMGDWVDRLVDALRAEYPDETA